jgi:hypothetical protein
MAPTETLLVVFLVRAMRYCPGLSLAVCRIQPCPYYPCRCPSGRVPTAPGIGPPGSAEVLRPNLLRCVGSKRAPWPRFVWSCRESPDPAGRRRVQRSPPGRAGFTDLVWETEGMRDKRRARLCARRAHRPRLGRSVSVYSREYSSLPPASPRVDFPCSRDSNRAITNLECLARPSCSARPRRGRSAGAG